MSDQTMIDPGGGEQPQRQPNQVKPGQTFAGAAQAASGTVPGGRSWLQIFSEAKEKRNILEIHVNRIDNTNSSNDDNQQKPKALTFDELSDFIFKILKIKETDNIGLDYFYGHKEIELKAGVDLTPYLHMDTPIRYLEYDIFVKKQETHFATRVLFRNVPLNVPDEELVNLALCYGHPVGGVRRERLTNYKDKGKLGSNRSLDVILNPGSTFENYFWMEGPLPSDQGRRITVTHQNQPQQCSNCFGYSKPKYGTEMIICPGNGNGRACKALGTDRTRMGPYSKVLQKILGYRSIKAKFSNVGPMEEPTIDEEDTEVTFGTIYKSPIVEKDELIRILQKEKENLILEQDRSMKEYPKLREDLTKTKSQLDAIQKKVKTHKINQAKEITEKRLAEAISLEPTYLRDNPHLVTLLAVFQDRDDFDVDCESGVVKPVHEDTFLKETLKVVMDISSEESTGKHVELDLCKERLGDVKNQLLESVKKRWIRPGRRDSICSLGSTNSKRPSDDDLSTERVSRPRTASLKA